MLDHLHVGAQTQVAEHDLAGLGHDLLHQGDLLGELVERRLDEHGVVHRRTHADATALDAELRDARVARQQLGKQIAKLVNALEEDGALAPVRDRLHTHQATDKELQSKIGELEEKRAALERETLSADTVAENYARLPALFDTAKAKGALPELRELLRGVIDVIEWHEDPADPKQAKALIRMFPVVNFWKDGGVNQAGVGSSSRKDWLRHVDSNHGPGD
jgi:hypothetical protein